VTVAGALLALPLVLALLAGGYLYTPDIPADVLEKKYAVPPSRFVEVDGLRVHYRDEGSGPVLVLIHGLTASLFDWDAWAERLRGRFRVIRLDLPGHGLTGPDPQGRYGWPAMADLVVRLLDRLGVDRAGVAGNSLGGAVAWQLAARHPDRVDRLILVAPVGYPIGGEMPFVLRLLANPVAGPLALRLTYRGASPTACGRPTATRPGSTRRWPTGSSSSFAARATAAPWPPCWAGAGRSRTRGRCWPTSARRRW
jgi:pimeloyl-ACP methyl ester carboxylesterase